MIVSLQEDGRVETDGEGEFHVMRKADSLTQWQAVARKSKDCQQPKARGDKEGFSPAGFRGSTPLLVPWLETSSLQN